MSARFSRETVQLLEAAGWYPGRSVPAEELPAAPRRFLEEFGGLVINVPRAGLLVSCSFALQRAGTKAYPQPEDDLWKAITALSGSPLVPVGEQGGSILLLMSADGRVFSVDDLWSFVGVIGESPDGALEHLLAPAVALAGYWVDDDGGLTPYVAA